MEFGKTLDKYTKLLPAIVEIEEDCSSYLKDVCNRNGGTIDLYRDGDNDNYVCVGYDGGNHPEEQNNMYSRVLAVSINDNDEVVLDTEDCEELPIWRLNWEDTYGVASFVYEYIDKE